MRKIILFIAFTFLNLSAIAQTFTYNGLNYKVIDFFSQKVEVASNPNFVGVANIPATVMYNSQSYQVTQIGYNAFENCSGLTSVTVPNSVTFISSRSFFACTGLTSFTFPSSVSYISDAVLSYCSNLTSVTIPNSVTAIGDNAFSYCSSLTSITIPFGVSSINGSAFKSSSLHSVAIPNSVTYIGPGAFNNCSSLTSVNIPYGISKIDDGVFGGCTSLTSVTIPNSVTWIGYYAFSYCTSFTSITIPDSVDRILEGAFYNCSSLTTVNCDIIYPRYINANVFAGVNQSACALNVNNISLQAYLAAPVWQNFNPINGVLSNNSFVKTNFSIYPNPSNDIINISLENNLQLEKVTIYNQLGQVVKTSAYNTISASDLANGSYFVEVLTNEGKATKTLIIK